MQVALDPATEEEVSDTVAVMGGEDWEFWIKDIKDAGLLALVVRQLLLPTLEVN